MKNDGYEEERFECARDLRDRLRDLQESLGEGERWLFRGVGDVRFPLLPPAWRTDKDAPELMTRIARELKEHSTEVRALIKRAGRLGDLWAYNGPLLKATGSRASDPRLIDHAIRFAAESECVHRFGELADELGFRLPNEEAPLPGPWILKGILSFPRADFLELEQSERGNVSQLACIAQHHGVPTRLLDWTRRPDVAAFFAAMNRRRKKATDVAVWALNWSAAEQIAIEKQGDRNALLPILHTLPRHYSDFLHRQAGVFTTVLRADLFYVREGRWPALTDVCPGLLRKHVLPASEVGELRRLLRVSGIFKSQLMPTLDNVAAELTESDVRR